jgi:hypothetical protein
MAYAAVRYPSTNGHLCYPQAIAPAGAFPSTAYCYPYCYPKRLFKDLITLIIKQATEYIGAGERIRTPDRLITNPVRD